MIRNDRQLAQTRQRAAAAKALAAEAESAVDRDTWSQAASEFEEEIADYLAVRSGTRHVFELVAIDDLAEALVKARIAKGWTQKELADELGVTEQMVQRDERVGYQKASIARLADVADALGFQLQGRLRPVGTDGSPPLSEGVRMWSTMIRIMHLGALPPMCIPEKWSGPLRSFEPWLRRHLGASRPRICHKASNLS